jgi:CRP/FNR family transcriptional regulator
MKKGIQVLPDATIGDFVKRCALLDGVTLEDLQRRCPTAGVFAFQHGSKIYSQGTRCDYLFFVISGLVKLARVSREGRELTTALMINGDFFGPALHNADSSHAQETATAKGAVSVWRVPKKEFYDLMLNHPVIGLRVLEVLAQRLGFPQFSGHHLKPDSLLTRSQPG